MIKILGDICFADGYFDSGLGIGSKIKNGDDPFLMLNRNPSDFWIGNFESTCSTSNQKPFFASISDLKNINHLDLYGIANNHIMQNGDKGFNDTINFFQENNINYVGSNKKRSTAFEHQGKKIGIIAFSLRPDNFSKDPLYWHIPELSEIESELKEINHCDFKIAYIHWGYEFINYPNIEQKQLAHWLVDLGFSLVIGMHPHVAQGCEIYKGIPIFYSLGNSVFNMPWDPTRFSLLINVDLSEKNPKIWSDYIELIEGFPKVVENVKEKYSRKYLDNLILIQNENENYFLNVKKYYKNYVKANRINIIKNLFQIPLKEQIIIFKDFFKRRIFKS